MARRLDGLIEAIADGLRTPGVKDKLEELERRKRTLETELTTDPPTTPLLHPNLAELYRRKVADLEHALEDPTLRDEALAILRSLVETVELHPTKDGFEIEFKGQMANMIGLSSPPRSRKNIEQFVISAKRVAGTRNQPTVFDLYGRVFEFENTATGDLLLLGFNVGREVPVLRASFQSEFTRAFSHTFDIIAAAQSRR